MPNLYVIVKDTNLLRLLIVILRTVELVKTKHTNILNEGRLTCVTCSSHLWIQVNCVSEKQ